MITAMRTGNVATRVVAEPGDGGVASGPVGDDGEGVPPLVGGVGVVPDVGGVDVGGVDVGGVGEGGEGVEAETLTLSFWPLEQWP